MKNMFNSIFKKSMKTKNKIEARDNQLTQAGKFIREERERLGLSRTNLSTKTKVSVTVLEALENGWGNQLPERPYLRRMLTALEIALKIAPGSLGKFYKFSNNPEKNNSNIFTPGNIEIFTTWPGSIIYFLILIISIFIINKQQANLARKHTQTIIPIYPEEIIKEDTNDLEE